MAREVSRVRPARTRTAAAGAGADVRVVGLGQDLAGATPRARPRRRAPALRHRAQAPRGRTAPGQLPRRSARAARSTRGSPSAPPMLSPVVTPPSSMPPSQRPPIVRASVQSRRNLGSTSGSSTATPLGVCSSRASANAATAPTILPRPTSRCCIGRKGTSRPPERTRPTPSSMRRRSRRQSSCGASASLGNYLSTRRRGAHRVTALESVRQLRNDAP